MIFIEKLVVNPFMLNTYILFDNSGECVIVDPGFSNKTEEQMLLDLLINERLKLVKLVNTHCHIDHIFGNSFVCTRFNLSLEAHKNESDNIKNAAEYARMFGMPSPKSPPISKFLKDGDVIRFGHSELKVLLVPGHAPGHIVLYSKESEFIICGDVLFEGSIGRTDLPGGDYNTLIDSIKSKLLVLDDRTKIYPGHGPDSTIGREKQFNPFLEG